MKTRIPTAAISRTLQAVATFGVVAPTITSETANVTVITDPSHVNQNVQSFGEFLRELAEEQEVVGTAKFPRTAEWNHASEKRFLNLVDREAKGVATSQELEALENLSDLRRRFEAPCSGDEVLREYEQHQLIRNLLQSLTKYVDFIGGPSIESGSTKRRAKAKA